ncbi:adenosylcobinamide-GDP ribazoletransferase [uncultured Friedmanniella sp.]|uniref:adenosylcobinamide-GDP ribazoletransferase n=1 Tax=uncultured Friedmanniella sp. TaxID=335381 RepID=UPI0035C9F249
MSLATARTGLRLAVGTLTVLPTGHIDRVDRSVARWAMLLGPLAVVPLALLAGAVSWLADGLDWPRAVAGLVTVATLALGTRALHLDGLADTVDGLGSGWNRERALEVMRRGDVGPMGVVALVLVLGVQAGVIGSLDGGWKSAVAVAVLVCCSRAALSVVCVQGVRAARPEGLGAAVAGSVPVRWAVATWLVVGGALALVWSLLSTGVLDGVLVAFVALIAVSTLVAWCVHRLGGVTGDVMGACVELALTVMLLGAVTRW